MDAKSHQHDLRIARRELPQIAIGYGLFISIACVIRCSITIFRLDFERQSQKRESLWIEKRTSNPVARDTPLLAPKDRQSQSIVARRSSLKWSEYRSHSQNWSSDSTASEVAASEHREK